MSLSDQFLILQPILNGWEADVLFTGGGVASGSGETQLEAMRATLEEMDAIIRDLSVKRGLLEHLIERTAARSP